MLKSLEEKGLIRREVSGTDKRFVRITLTEAGKARREQARAGVIRFNEIIREKIAPEKLAVFMDVLKEINTLVDKENQRTKIV